jgi:hypothetical protein
MSIVVEVRFPSSSLPAAQAWQDSIASHGFAVELDHDFDLATSTGFLPARDQGRAAGFEFYHEREPDEQSCVWLKWSGNAREAVSGIIAAACLCEMTGGHLDDTEAGETIQALDAVPWARQQEADFQSMIEAEDQRPAVRAQTAASRPWWRFW